LRLRNAMFSGGAVTAVIAVFMTTQPACSSCSDLIHVQTGADLSTEAADEACEVTLSANNNVATYELNAGTGDCQTNSEASECQPVGNAPTLTQCERTH
jgi:hypothetical protein